MPLADFRYISRFRVAYADVDMLQHVNHASYVVWAETARCGYFVEVMKEPFTGRRGMILARLEFDYEQPLDFDEEVAVGCRISRLGRKSFDFSYEIWSDARQLRAAQGISTMVAYDYEAKQSIGIPDTWVKAVTEYELIPPKR
jgi:acyl-CoA thioester hydrolase